VLVYRTAAGVFVAYGQKSGGRLFSGVTIDQLFTGEVTAADLETGGQPADSVIDEVPAPIESQEVWAAGVTYLRSRSARMAESEQSGGADFYDKVYHANRPELFFKATPHRCVGTGGTLKLRQDSKWMVPEPELTLAIKSDGTLLGFTVGNDLSSRDIEGENPLYLPQAKVFDGCAGLGPGIWLQSEWPSPETEIAMTIHRSGAEVFSGSIELSQMKQTLPNLVEHLYRECSFPHGCFLMTGTGLVPPDDFTLHSGDEVAITIQPVGVLKNLIA